MEASKYQILPTACRCAMGTVCFTEGNTTEDYDAKWLMAGSYHIRSRYDAARPSRVSTFTRDIRHMEIQPDCVNVSVPAVMGRLMFLYLTTNSVSYREKRIARAKITIQIKFSDNQGRSHFSSALLVNILGLLFCNEYCNKKRNK